MNPFRGVIVASVTPFRADGSLDQARIAPLVERAIAAGAHGMVACGSTGEVGGLGNDERRRITRAMVAAANRRIPILACVGAATTAEAMGLAIDARAAGATGLLLQAPWYSLPTRHEIHEYVRAVAEAAVLPIVLYNYPARTGVDLDADLVLELADLPHVVAIKESSGQLERIADLRRRAEGRIAVLCGSDDLAFTAGCDGWISGSANLLPRLHVALHRCLVEDHDVARGREVWDLIAPVLSLLEQGGRYVQSIKAGLAHLGVPVGAPRRPLLTPSREELAPLLGLLDSVRGSEERA